MIVEFTGIVKHKVVKRAMDYWYRNMKDIITLYDFFSNCSIRKDNIGYTIILRKEKIK